MVLSICLLQLESAFAQTDTANRPIQNLTIGLNLSDVFINNPYVEPSFAIQAKLNSKYSTRIQLGYSVVKAVSNLNSQTLQPFNQFTIDSSSNNIPSQTWSANLGLAGLYFVPISERFNFYSGLEFIYQRGHSDYHAIFDVQQDFQSGSNFFNVTDKSKTNYTGFGVLPIFGVEWKFAPKLSLAIESQVIFLKRTYEKSMSLLQIQTSSFNPNEFITDTHSTRKWIEVSSQFSPLSGVYLYYTF